MRPVLSHSSASWPVLVICAAVAGLHLTGLARLLPRDGGGASRGAVIGEAAVFEGGVLVALLAIVSPVGYWSGIHVWTRALQDLFLAAVAPGLIVLGAPWSALALSLGRRDPGAGDEARSRWPSVRACSTGPTATRRTT